MQDYKADITEEAPAYKVILYGAGKDLRGYVFELEFISQMLLKNNEMRGSFLENVVRVVDGNLRKQGEKIALGNHEFCICSPQVLQEMSREDMEKSIILITASRYAWEIENIFKNWDIEAFYVIAAELKCSWGDGCPPKIFQKLMKHWAMEYDYSDISDLSAKLLSWLDAEQVIVPEIGIKLTQKCTLSCKYCIDRIPFLPQYDVPLDVVLHDLELLLKHALYIGELTFVTGEVLIYPYLPEVLELAVRSPNVHRIMINTNGTVIPNEKSVPFLQSLKCIINISDYGNLLKMAKAVDFYERNGINFTVRTEMKWKPYGAYPVRQGLNIESLRGIFATCSVANGCPPMMNDGKFYICGIAEKFHALGECCSTRDYVDLLGKGTFKENYNRMMNVDYLECCDMCDTAVHDNSEYVEAGVQMDSAKQWSISGYTISKRMR